MNKITCASQNMVCQNLACWCLRLCRFGRLSPAAVHSADCRFETEVKWLIHVSSVVTYLRKNSFLIRWSSCNQRSESSTCCCFWSTESKRSTHFVHSFLIGKIHANRWIYCLLISLTPLLSHATSIYDRPKRICGAFWCFPRLQPNLDDLSVQHHLCLYDRV